MLNLKLFNELHVPKLTTNIIGNFYSDEEFHKIVNSVSNKSSCKIKIICLLCLLYALRPNEINKLKFSNYSEGKIFVRNTWISLSPIIIEILYCYIQTERNPSLCLESNTEWLFFGNRFNTPLSSSTISKYLRKHNILSLMAFRTVLTCSNLEYGIVPSILIKDLGINRATATNYYKNLNINNTFRTEMVNKNPQHILNENNIHTVYILRCSDKTYYTGYTYTIIKILKQHQNGNGSTYTKTRTPVGLVYTEEFSYKSSAIKREKQIKKLTIFEKEKLIQKSRAK